LFRELPPCGIDASSRFAHPPRQTEAPASIEKFTNFHPMNTEESFLALKLHTMKRIIDLQDPAILRRVRDILQEDEPTPQHLLDLIKRRQEQGTAEDGTPLEEYLEEIKDL
jgi:hypothetical protein